MFKLKLHWQILIGMTAGVILAIISQVFNFEDFVINKISLLGVLFLRALQMIIIPLIITSIISGVANIGSSENFGRLSIKTFSYYIVTSLSAILTGLLFVNIIQPGIGAVLPETEMLHSIDGDMGKLLDTLIGIIPSNIIDAMVKGDILPIIFFSLIFGFFINKTPDPYKSHLTLFFQSVFEVMMRMTRFIIGFAPLGVFALIAKTVAETGIAVFLPLAKYMGVVILSLGLHACFTLPLLLYFVGGISPIAQFKAMSSTLLTAFSTSSSSATLPLTIDSVENNAGVSNKISSFVLPLGATINMDGTALYECVAAMFIAQVAGVELGVMEQFIVVLTALLASIGAAGIPMAGFVMMAIILNAVGLDLEYLALILAVDRPLDMLRTSVNVWSDSCGTVIIARSEGENNLKVLKNKKG